MANLHKSDTESFFANGIGVVENLADPFLHFDVEEAEREYGVWLPLLEVGIIQIFLRVRLLEPYEHRDLGQRIEASVADNVGESGGIGNEVPRA